MSYYPPLPPGQTLAASSSPVVIASDNAPLKVSISGAINPVTVNFQNGSQLVSISGTIQPLTTRLLVAGTDAINGGLAGALAVGGGAADSAATNTNPVLMGGKVKTATDATYVASDLQVLTCTTDMQLVTKPYSIPELDFQTTLAFPVSSASTAVKAAGGANVRNNVTGLKISNGSNENVVAIVLDGTVPLYQDYVPSGSNLPMTTFQTPLRGTANTALNIAISGQANHPGWTNGGLVFVSVQGYTAF